MFGMEITDVNLEPFILSASREQDVSAFYADWFVDQL